MPIATANAADVARNLRALERLATAAPQMLDASATSLALWVARAAALLEAPERPVRIVLDMTGGVLQGASIDRGAIDLLAVDYDTENMRPVPQVDGRRVDGATVVLGAYMVQPAFVEAMFADHEAANVEAEDYIIAATRAGWVIVPDEEGCQMAALPPGADYSLGEWLQPDQLPAGVVYQWRRDGGAPELGLFLNVEPAELLDIGCEARVATLIQPQTLAAISIADAADGEDENEIADWAGGGGGMAHDDPAPADEGVQTLTDAVAFVRDAVVLLDNVVETDTPAALPDTLTIALAGGAEMTVRVTLLQPDSEG